jgi:hypothetical protein
MSALDTLAALRVCWQTIKDCFDLTADLPDWDCILQDADLAHSEDAACTILVNLLTEAMERTDRFSPWYKAPAETFGLHQPLKRFSYYYWQLTPEAAAKWEPTLEMLAEAIANDPELSEIKETIKKTAWLRESMVAATCGCKPTPPIGWVPPHVLLDATLTCSICEQPLRRVENLQ